MTNRINADPPSQSISVAADPAAQVGRSQPKDTLAPAAVAGSQANDTATITDKARASAQILDQARAADGIDHTAVAQLKTAIQSQSYNVPAERLAASIISALGEIKP